MELKFHQPEFEEEALKIVEPEETLEELLAQHDEMCAEYRRLREAQEKAEAPWRRTRINDKGEEESYIDYDAWEKANSKECWSYTSGEFGGFNAIDMLEHDIDVKISHMNQREREQNSGQVNKC